MGRSPNRRPVRRDPQRARIPPATAAWALRWLGPPALAVTVSRLPLLVGEARHLLLELGCGAAHQAHQLMGWQPAACLDASGTIGGRGVHRGWFPGSAQCTRSRGHRRSPRRGRSSGRLSAGQGAVLAQVAGCEIGLAAAAALTLDRPTLKNNIGKYVIIKLLYNGGVGVVGLDRRQRPWGL